MRRFNFLGLVVFLTFGIRQDSRGAEVLIRSGKVDQLTMDPNDAVWQKAQAVEVPLSKQSMVSPHGGGSVATLTVQSLYSAKEVAFRLQWKDATKDDRWDLTNRFSDACALQFPMKSKTLPSPFMGDINNPVNIWRWAAIVQQAERFPKAYADFYRQDAIETTIKFHDKAGENLIAVGFGTLTRQNAQDIEANGEWVDGRWSVVFKRKFSSKEGAVFKENAVFPVGFAVWDGTGKERDGMKSVGFWQWLILGKAEAPYGKSPAEKGKSIFARYGCATCHGPDGKGGVKNPNSQGGEIPRIDRVAEGFTEEEVKKVIMDGRIPVPEDAKAPLPPFWMNAWKSVLSEEELHNLVDYLFSLLPKGKKEEW
ncbi:MAG: c-type cytochrome [Elusimicrobia bacterium]|nr:c-type cytochrome [Elusimicrobiota bacterium]